MVKSNNGAKVTKINSFSTNREVVVKRGLSRTDNNSLALRGLLSHEWKALKGMAKKTKKKTQNGKRSNNVRWDLLSETWSNKIEDDFQSDIALDKGFIRLKPNQSEIEKELPVFVHHKQSFSKMVEKDIQASGFMNALQDRVGHAKNITNNGKFELTYNKWWDDKTQINEKWYVIKSNNLFFKSDMVWVYPYDMATCNLIIARY